MLLKARVGLFVMIFRDEFACAVKRSSSERSNV